MNQMTGTNNLDVRLPEEEAWTIDNIEEESDGNVRVTASRTIREVFAVSGEKAYSEGTSVEILLTPGDLRLLAELLSRS